MRTSYKLLCAILILAAGIFVFVDASSPNLFGASSIHTVGANLDVLGNLTVDGTTTQTTSTISGDLTVAGDVLPDARGIRNIGSATLGWNNVFASGTATLGGTPAITTSNPLGVQIKSYVNDALSTAGGLIVNLVPAGALGNAARIASFRKNDVEKAYINYTGELFVNSAINSIAGSMTFNASGANVVAMNFDSAHGAGTLGFISFDGGTGAQFVMSSLYKGYVGFPTVFTTHGAAAASGDLFGPVGSDFEFRGLSSSTRMMIGGGATMPASTNLAVIASTVTSTVQIGSATQISCVALGDDDGGGTTYLTVHRGVPTFSTTSCK